MEDVTHTRHIVKSKSCSLSASLPMMIPTLNTVKADISKGHEPSKADALETSNLLDIHRCLGIPFLVFFVLSSLGRYPASESRVILVLGWNMAIAKLKKDRVISLVKN